MDQKNYDKYDRAKKKVKEIKGFYNHIWLFVFINIAVLVVRFYVFPKIGFVSDDEGFQNWLDWNTYLMPVFWAIGIACHGIWVFRHRFTKIKDWEERKIKEFMDIEDEEKKRWK